MANVGRLQEEARDSRRQLEERSRELDRVRQEYHADLKERGERIGDLTEDFLREKFSPQLEEMRT